MATETQGCRFCGVPLTRTFIDLGMSPLCQSVLEPTQLNEAETFFPLHVFVCESCRLVQLQQYVVPDQIFSEYAYFSSFSDSMLAHAQNYVDAMLARHKLDQSSKVVEVASNDGYLLQYFVKRGIPVLGIEPAANVARAAVDKGVPTCVRFFGVETARLLRADGIGADLLVANNVLPHVPDLHDFVGGIKILLQPEGIGTIEFQHLMRMIEGNQFDTIYQEHYSYLSLAVVRRLLEHHGLRLFDVEEISTHGGSLRIYLCHRDAQHPVSENVARVIAQEEQRGVECLSYYEGYEERVKETKRQLLSFLIDAKRNGKTVAGYGAAGKTNTLLNFCGIRSDFIDYFVDRNPYKQGRFLPGSHIPVHAPEKISETKPDYLFVGPWNLLPEIMTQTSYIRQWGGKWVVPIPEVRVVE